MKRALVTIVWVFLGACQVALRATAKPECETNRDCTSGKICFYGTCEKPNNAALPAQTWVEIVPPATSGILPQQRPVTITNAVFDASLAQTRNVTGQMLDSAHRPVPGTVEVQRISLIPGRILSFSLPALDNANFSTTLEPGVYLPIFLPDDSADSPPLPLAQWSIADQDLHFALTYPDASTLNEISGRIAASAQNALQGISARVYASQSARGLSSTAVQTNADGSFHLLIVPSVSPVTLNVGPSTGNVSGTSNPFVPQIALPAIAVTKDTELPDIYLDGLAASTTLSGTVSGIVASGPDQTLVGTAVFAETQIAGGIYQTGTLSDDSGRFTLALVTSTSSAPLTYALTLVPPPDSGYGSQVVRYDLPPTGTPADLSLRLAARFVLSGTVTDANGVTVSGTQVTALPVGNAPFQTAVQTLTGATGRFALRVDPGNYTLQIHPAPGSPLAWTNAAVTVSNANIDTTIALPEAIIVTGEISPPPTTAASPNAIGVVGSQLNFYAAVGSGSLIIGSSVVDANNHYAAVLPATLPP